MSNYSVPIGPGLYARTRRDKAKAGSYTRFHDNTLELQLAESIRQIEEKKMQQRTNGSIAAETVSPVPAVVNNAHDKLHADDNRPMKLPPDMARALYAPLPAEAIKPHPSKAYLSSVKAIFVIERLNEVFGIGGWTYRTHVVEADPARAMVVVRVVLVVAEYGIRLEQFGGSDNEDRGDAYKGAVTDALSKIGSYLGIAMDVYKGGGPTKQNPRGMAVAQSSLAAEPPPTAQQIVAQQKIASGNPATSKPWENRGQMKRAFGILRERVGEVAYLTELARYGVTPELNWKTAEAAVECWHHLDHLASKAVA